MAAEVGVEHDGRLGVGHPRPSLEGRVVAVDGRVHDGADVERLLAVGVGVVGEDVADRREGDAVDDVAGRRATSRSSGSVVAARRGKRSPGAT